MKSSVVVVYDTTLKDASSTYLAAVAAVTSADTSFAKENKESTDALAALDAPYREARAVVAAIKPETALPDTLKTQPTDTDKLKAIEDLLDVLDDHVGEAWADTVLQGEFGTKAPAAVKEVTEAIGANKVFSHALEQRATLYGPTYERYLGFKRVVREALGAKSKQYKRIHLRAAATSAEEEPEGGGGEGTPATPAAPDAPSGDPKPK